MVLQSTPIEEGRRLIRRRKGMEPVAAPAGSTPRIPRSTSSPGGVSVDRTITHQASDFLPRREGEDNDSSPSTTSSRSDQSNTSTTEVTPENTLRGRRIHFNPEGAEGLNEGLVTAMNDLLGGTDRQGIITRQWESMLPRLNEMADRDREDLVKRNVALGRTGSGVFTRNMGDLERRIARDRETMLGQLIADASNRSVEDRFRSVGLGGSLSDRLYRQDLGEAEFLRGERGNQDQLAREATAAEQSRLSMLQSLGYMGRPDAAEQDLMNILSGQAASADARGEAADARQAGGFGNALQLLAFSGIGGGGGGGSSDWFDFRDIGY